ncbi:hypothetical protein SSPSH_003765 [Salinisphaera shabanensis E1L3A]|uniref:Uncharacterized protein n=1 Tax=Salinisphaera shabanensis E1L3A TaxID=1033802 RepID=U2E0D9_9GAMM|nr:hypothetical protein SSPSH_003765 [Salinisphaera shabanensis E1L3A]
MSLSFGRFIPAPAGNGGYVAHSLLYRLVHPRACGERVLARVPGGHEGGSSPRLRGTVLHPVELALVFRFIPAPAGNG